MTAATGLRVVAGGRPKALDRVIAVAKRMEEHENVDRWEFADDVKEAVVELAGSENGFRDLGADKQTHTGLYAALDKIQQEIRDAGAPEVASQNTIRGAYQVSVAWPPEERVTGANYWAHFELRAREYDGRRQAILARLVKRSRDGRVNTKDVRLWKSDKRPVDLTPRDERLDKNLRSALRRWATPQKFNDLHEDERSTAVKILNRLANEIAAGEFE